MERNAQNGNDQGHYRYNKLSIAENLVWQSKAIEKKRYSGIFNIIKYFEAQFILPKILKNEIPEKHFSYFVPQWDKLLDTKVILVKMETEPIIKKSNYQYTKLNKSKVVM